MPTAPSLDSVPTPRDSLFPRASMRPGQYAFYQDAQAAAREGRILFADAPTGIGKTAAALAATLEVALLAGRKVLFLTNRNSHHLQAIIEARAIIRERAEVLARMRPEQPVLRVIDKISKDKMCLRLVGHPGERPAYLLCEIARCPYQTPRPEYANMLFDRPLSAIEATEQGARTSTFCAHQTAILAAGDADLVICDYSYLFNPTIREIMLPKMRITLEDCTVIVDEAHNLPKRVRDINERRIDEETLKKAIRGLNEIRKLAAEVDQVEMGSQAGFIARHLRTVISPGIASLVYGVESVEEQAIPAGALRFFAQKGSRLGPDASSEQVAIPDLIEEACAFFSEQIAKTTHERIDFDGIVALKELNAFMRPAADYAWGSRVWGVFLKRGPPRSGTYGLRATLFDPAEISTEVFARMHSGVLMSGTLAGKDSVRELMGIHSKRCQGLKAPAYPTPFSSERQPISICTVASSRLSERGDAAKLARMAALIEQASRACYPDSFAVFYPSYEFMEQVLGQVRLDAYEVHKEGRGEDGHALTALKAKLERPAQGRPLALHAVIGAKYNEGIDFTNNPFKLIIVAGFPYPKKTSAQQAYENYLAAKFSDKAKANEYAALYPAMVGAMQTIGRGIRQSSDWCYCLLIDDRFVEHARLFSQAISRRVRVVRPETIEVEIAAFASRMRVERASGI